MSQAADDLLKRADKARRDRQLDSARADLLEATELLRLEKDDIRLAPALRELGELERKLGQGVFARKHYEEAVELLRSPGDVLKLAHTVRHLGDVYRDAGDFCLAAKCYTEALELYRSRSDASQLDVANAVRSMAVLKQESGATEEARTLWAKARELYATAGIESGVAESSARLARLGTR